MQMLLRIMVVVLIDCGSESESCSTSRNPDRISTIFFNHRTSCLLARRTVQRASTNAGMSCRIRQKLFTVLQHGTLRSGTVLEFCDRALNNSFSFMTFAYIPSRSFERFYRIDRVSAFATQNRPTEAIFSHDVLQPKCARTRLSSQSSFTSSYLS
uniref:(northern house mosquito) hypothetical protein n=1 Tax=Culex pipiens TaxID=7175 RepID=A0A8D8L2Z7_CULPI